MLSEHAPAKVNLTLRVLGKRSDGYHELESLVVFAEHGDLLSFKPGPETALFLTGPFGEALEAADHVGAGNLVLRARDAFAAHYPDLAAACSGSFTLEKHVPVASGLGGGSSDAAATLRLLARHTGKWAEQDVLAGLALELGADVPVCLNPHPCIMRGVGERLSYLEIFPEMALVLVNPGVAVSTADVFRELKAAPYGDDAVSSAVATGYGTSDFCTLMHLLAVGNDLQAPAYRLNPDLARVSEAFSHRAGDVRHHVMSGSGATHVAVYETLKQAEAGRDMLREHYPDWWCEAARVTPPRA